jgi:hypothetical protein
MQKIILSLFAVMLLLNITTAQDKSTVYDWPIKPGTTEWKALQTHDEMLAVLQIPVNIFNNMSTEDLVETCLNYPLFLDIWAFNSYQDGIDKAIASFNGFQELIKRPEAGKELLQRYQKINLSELGNKKTDIEKWKFKMQVCKLEALLSQYMILKNMPKFDRLSLLKYSLDKNKIILGSDEYSFFSYESNSFLAVKILSMENSEILNKKLKEDKNFEQFFKQGTGTTMEMINDIVEMSNLFLSNSN